MSHGDAITDVPAGFVATATRAGAPVAAMHDPERRLFGLQFHPEVVHTDRGSEVFDHFLHRRLRVPAGVDARLDHRAAGGGGAGPGRRATGCCARCQRRRRLRRGRGAGAQGGGRTAHVRLRRHRPDARRRGRPGRGHVPAPVQGRPRARQGGRPLLRRAGGRHRPRAQAQDHRRAVHPHLRGGGARPRRRRSGDGDGGARDRDRRRSTLPGAGDAVPRRDRVGQRHRGQHQVAPQRGRPARGPRLRPGGAAAPAVQGRGARRGRGARPARTRSCGASPSPGRASGCASSAR